MSLHSLDPITVDPGEVLGVADLDLGDVRLALDPDAVDVRPEAPGGRHHGVPHLARGVADLVTRRNPGLGQPLHNCKQVFNVFIAFEDTKQINLGTLTWVGLGQLEPRLEVLCLGGEAGGGLVLDGAGAVLGPLVRPQRVRDAAHLHVRPQPRHVAHDGLHLAVVVVPRVVAEVGGDLVHPCGPQAVHTPGGRL